jgi:hypothetical protein
VDGSAEVAGDNRGNGELSSARTTFAGAPRGIQNVKGALRPWITILVKVTNSTSEFRRSLHTLIRHLTER